MNSMYSNYTTVASSYIYPRQALYSSRVNYLSKIRYPSYPNYPMSTERSNRMSAPKHAPMNAPISNRGAYGRELLRFILFTALVLVLSTAAAGAMSFFI